jgi:hypothetical protein
VRWNGLISGRHQAAGEKPGSGQRERNPCHAGRPPPGARRLVTEWRCRPGHRRSSRRDGCRLPSRGRQSPPDDVANRSTTVRKAVSPITRERRRTLEWCSCISIAESNVDAAVVLAALLCKRSRVRRPASLRCGASDPRLRHTSRCHMLWSFLSRMTSPTKRMTVLFPRFCHQCSVPLVSGLMSPALWTMGAAQLLAYSTISPSAM